MIILPRKICSLFVLLILSGCMASPEVTMLRESHPPKQATEHIDVFYTKKPDKPYIEIAKIKIGDTEDEWNLKQIKLKAREIGADGVIIIGRVGSYGYGTALGTPSGNFATTAIISASEGYGMVAIAIVYKQ